MGGICQSCIACEMILDMLSNLTWESSLMESCFSWATIGALKYFCVAGVIKEKGRLTLPKAILTGCPRPLANAAMHIPPVSTVDVSRFVSLMLNIVMDRVIFFAFCSHFSISLRKNASISDNLFSRYDCGSCSAVGLNLDKFWFHCHIRSFFI